MKNLKRIMTRMVEIWPLKPAYFLQNLKLYLLLIFGLCVLNNLVFAEVYKATDSNYVSFLNKLKPGDELLLNEGYYKKDLVLNNLNGNENSPIVIKGTAHKTIFYGNAGSNTVDIINCSYIEIKDLVLDGQNINGIDGIKMGSSGVCHHNVIENNIIKDYANNQQQNGISSKVPVWNVEIRRNQIINVGTGMYLGNSDGTKPFVAGLIENNLFLNTVGYNCEIKHQLDRIGISTKDKKNQTIIRNNVFSKEQHGSGVSVGDRPNLLIGHLPLSGSGSDDSYVVYNNFFYQNISNEYLFQGEGNIYFFNNILINSFGGGANFSAHKDKPKNIFFYFNTVLSVGRPLFLSGEDTRFKQIASGNIFFCNQPLKFSKDISNLKNSLNEASNYLINPFGPLGQLNVCPKPGKLNVSEVDMSFCADIEGFMYSFNDVKRSGVVAGAFEQTLDLETWNLDLTLLKEKTFYEIKAGDNKALIDISKKIALRQQFDHLAKELEKIGTTDSRALEMLEYLLDTERGLLTEAEKNIETNKVSSYETLCDLSNRWGLHEIGARAKELCVPIKQDVIKLLRTKQLADNNMKVVLAKVNAIIAKLKPVKGKRDISDSDFKKLNSQSLQTVAKYLESMLEKYPDSSLSGEIKNILREIK